MGNSTLLGNMTLRGQKELARKKRGKKWESHQDAHMKICLQHRKDSSGQQWLFVSIAQQPPHHNKSVMCKQHLLKEALTDYHSQILSSLFSLPDIKSVLCLLLCLLPTSLSRMEAAKRQDSCLSHNTPFPSHLK